MLVSQHLSLQPVAVSPQCDSPAVAVGSVVTTLVSMEAWSGCGSRAC